MNLRCLIVDDEPPAHKVLENYIGKVKTLSLAHNCYNAIEALNYLHENKVDLIFLDINMPELTGLEMLKTMDNPPAVILTTAYSEFALESYEFGVIDYLMKPIRFDRFLKGINKVIQDKTKNAVHENKNLEPSKAEKDIFIKVDGAQQKVILDEVLYLESKGNFVLLHLQDKRHLTADTLTKMNDRLSKSGFLRIHKSYIININKVVSLQGNQVQVGEKYLPIGNSYKQVVLGKIGLV